MGTARLRRFHLPLDHVDGVAEVDVLSGPV
jgi:hypothetical protein